MILTMNQKEMELGGKYLGWLREANNLLGDSRGASCKDGRRRLSVDTRHAQSGDGRGNSPISSRKN